MANIVGTAVAAGSFKTLVAAVQAAGLVDTLSGPGPFTVFAPPDPAFAKLPSGTVDGLLKDIPKLTTILTYHVVPGKYMSEDIKKLTTVKTVQGGSLTITPEGGFIFHHGIQVGGANVTKADIECDNGVIHVIDSVLMPS